MSTITTTKSAYGPLNPRPVTAEGYRVKAEIARRAGDLTQAARYESKARTAPEIVEDDVEECNDCGRPAFYDYEVEAYRHVEEPERGCFLIAAEIRSPIVGAPDSRPSTPALRSIASDRAEDESCQRSTDGCCIDHATDAGSCETW
jgi:hypothetical protein